MLYKSLLDAIRTNQNSNKGIIFISGDNDEKYLGYDELFSEAGKILNVLQSNGLKPGFELVFQIEDNEKFICIFWACILGKIIPVPVAVGNNDEHRLKLLKIWTILNNPFLITDKKVLSGIETFATSNSLSKEFEEIKVRTIYFDEMDSSYFTGQIVEADLKDIAFIQFSSGSTGDPKGVVLTHKNLLTNINAIIECAKVTTNDKSLSWMPLTHDMGLIGFHLTALVAKIDQYIMPTNLFIRRPTLWIKKVNEHRISSTSSPNFGYRYFLSSFKPEIAEGWDLSCIRLVFNGAEPIFADLSEEFLNKMEEYKLNKKSMFNVYGLAEACLAVTFPPTNEGIVSINVDRNRLSIGAKIIENTNENSIRLVDLGYPVTDCNIRICDDENKTLAERTVGYIQIKGNNVTSGYYNNNEATSKMISQDGWLNTGDLGFIWNGRLIFSGRAKDIIFVNGQNYYPHDIEKIAEGVEGIELGRIAACGVFNKELQRDSLLLFVLFKKKTEEFVSLAVELRKYISSKMGLNVDLIIPVREIPKTTSGKIQRYRLGEMYLMGKYNDVLRDIEHFTNIILENRVCENPTTEIEIELMTICKEFIPTTSIGINDNFFEVGASSIILIQIAERVDRVYPGKTSITDLFAYPTISKLANFIEKGNTINLPVLKLPDEFFIERKTTVCESVMFEFMLSEPQFRKVNDLCRDKNISLDDFITLPYIFLLSQITGQHIIPIQIMIHKEDMVYSVNYDIHQLQEISNLLIGQKSSKAFSYSINDVENVKLERDESSVVIFLYNKKFMNCNIDLLNIYDILLEISAEDNELVFFCDYNNLKLNGHKVKKMMNDYVSLILSQIQEV